MAPHHNNQDTISERRLRPIYDWLDNGNNKKALQEAEKVLRKQPTFQCCRALKSLALMRLGKEEEAMSILDKILEECPTDEGALQAMTIGYREMKLPDKICTLYENAVKKDPYNEEFLSHLFMAYVRLGQLKRQQATAMSLYKVKMKNPYYFWSVMSLVLQAIEGDEKMAQTVSLPLALKMVQKMDKEGKMEQEQETMLYLMILELKQDWKGAVDVLNSPLGKKLENSASFHLHCINKRIELEERLENWPEVARLSRNILLSQPDSWETATSYVRAVHCIQKSGRKGSLKEMQYDLKPNRIDRTLVEAESLMDCLGKGYPGLRGPKLAKLEICYRTMDGCSLSLQDLLMDYIDVFGTRPVCFSDIKKYLKAIPLEQRNNFILKLRERYPDEVPNSSGEIYREICLSGVERFLGKHSDLSTEMVESIVSGLINRYVACQPLVAHLERTELRPCDGYLVIASHLLWEKWETTRNIRFFLFSCSLLRLGLQYSPSNWQMKFLLIRLCGRAGAGSLCDEVHAGIDVKHIILDTLGWVILRVLFSSGQTDRLDRLYCQMSRFYSHSPKETIEYIIQAYKCGNFSQICDIYNLKRRIQTSFLSHLVQIDRLMFDLLFKTLNHDQAVNHVGYPEYSTWDNIPWDRLRDNRDFRTIVSYEPEETATTEELVNDSFKVSFIQNLQFN
ncbi:N-alpha-acetyltransferase 25, NatB auxiliary subunit [Eurytemora carolleeae]|uniref:N-alpha-acetyltransferase 25, NatB auxiliary subunit n=1 Tax=Eurytemora carolleeae TaxID=1294199 RepID=UPI000C77F8D2|nr:N-alpha-acetyltransferase 25, NatB auxiliary subunit [Eurytemora carolleeae]|eukprot:XP_023344164.1 N-alpha-acetyltransferase 25, NatB auxiliary subunit-like [Eurytemora affinis]